VWNGDDADIGRLLDFVSKLLASLWFEGTSQMDLGCQNSKEKCGFMWITSRPTAKVQ